MRGDKIFLGADVLFQCTSMLMLFEVLVNSDILERFLKLGEEFSFLAVLLRVSVFFVPRLRPGGSIVFEMHGNLRDPEAEIA